MTAAAAVLPPAVVKEIRALFPTYAAALVTIVVGSFGHSHTLIAAGLLAFAFGLGRARRAIVRARIQPPHARPAAVTAARSPPVVPLQVRRPVRDAAHADSRGPVDVPRRPPACRVARHHPSMLILAAACGLFVAPWLTLVSRSTLAAVVFTIAIPGVLAVGSRPGGRRHLRPSERRSGSIGSSSWSSGPAWSTICAIGAVASWRMFMRLEVIEGHGPAMQLPGWLGGRSETTADAPSRPRHRVRMLLAKELRLQQMAFVVAALFTVVWLAMAGLERSVADAPRLPLNGLAILYGGVMAMLIGAMASAEERQLGTAEWQILLPMPAWQQWALKAGVALGLAVLLAVVLPAALRYFSPAGDDFHQAARAWRETTGIVVILASAELVRVVTVHQRRASAGPDLPDYRGGVSLRPDGRGRHRTSAVSPRSPGGLAAILGTRQQYHLCCCRSAAASSSCCCGSRSAITGGRIAARLGR